MSLSGLASSGLAATLGGCGAHEVATFAEPVAVNSGTAPKSITLISTLHDTFEVKKIGITVFGNAIETADISSWNVNGHLTKVAATYIGQRAKVRAVHAPGGFDERGPQHVLADREGQDAAVLRRLAGTDLGDLAIVITPHISSFGNSNQVLQGIGIVWTDALLASSTYVFALPAIRVYDGRTLKPVSLKSLGMDYVFSLTSPIKGPHRQVDATWRPSGATAVAADARLKGAVFSLLDEHIPKLLDKSLVFGSPSAAAAAPQKR